MHKHLETFVPLVQPSQYSFENIVICSPHVNKLFVLKTLCGRCMYMHQTSDVYFAIKEKYMHPFNCHNI